MSDELNNNLNEESLNSDNNNTVMNSNEINSMESNNAVINDVVINSDQINNTNENTTSTYNFWAEQVATTSSRQIEETQQAEQYTSQNSQQTPQYAYLNPQQMDTYNNSTAMEYSDQNNSNTKNKSKSGFIKRAIKFALGAAVFGVIAGATFIGFNWAYYTINPEAAPLTINIGTGFTLPNGIKLNLNPPTELENRIATTTVSKEVIQQRTDITDVVDNTMPSIVTITSTFSQSYDWFGQQYDQENEGGGSGIIVGKNDKELLIATNNHVVEGASPIMVTFIDDTQAEAVIKGTDSAADLAVIAIDLKSISKETLNAIMIAQLGDSESVKVGQMAIAIGNALGYGQSVTVGYISAKDREVAIDANTMVLLQTDAAINPGNSGGALLNLNGEVIGINSVKYASSEVEGMGYAIPISRAIPIINDLMQREILAEENRGFLGVYIKQVTEEVANMYNWPIGIYVISAVEDSSAEKAGIIAGDIITKVNGTEVTAETQLQEKISSYRIGTKVTLTVMRMVDGKYVENEIDVTLGKNPSIEKN